MTDAATPAELEAIAEECQEFEASYYADSGQLTYAVGGEATRRCDFCKHWQGGECDIYKREKDD